MSKKLKTASIAYPKTTLRDATIEDLLAIRPRIKYSTRHFFGEIDLELLFKTAVYTIVLQYEPLEKIAAYANFENFPNISALPKECWTDWIRIHYKMTQCTYGNTLFLTFLVLDDPYNPNLLGDIFREVFLREPKIKFICVAAPPIDSFYEDVLEVHCKRIFSVDSTISRLSQSLYFCEKNTLVPKMRLRRALAEDNDELVEIIDEKLKSVRVELGDFYIAEQVLRQDPSETIIVAEISNVTIGMIWLNSNIQHQTLVEHFEITAYGHFLRPQQRSGKMTQKTVIDIENKRSDLFFERSPPGHQRSYGQERQSKLSGQTKMSLVNLYIASEESSEDVNGDDEIDSSPTKIFNMWSRIDKSLKDTYNYVRESEKIIKMPVTTEATNAFAIQLFGLSSTIDPRRMFDLIAGAFSSYPDRDYCIISVPSSVASSDCLSGPLLRYFSHVAPRSGCKISDCLYVTHRNSFLSEIQVDFLTLNDIADVEDILCFTAAQGQAMYNFADILQSITEFLENLWSVFDVFIMRSAGVTIGFAILSQNCAMCELRTNYEVFDSDDYFQDWTAGELNYLYLHPAFNWEWRHVAREIFRLTGYFSMHYKLQRKFSQPILNSLLLKMFPISPRKPLHKPPVEPYALYYLNIKITQHIRTQIENRIIIVGFNEVCKGFLKALIFSPRSKGVQCLNITVITDCPGFIEAEYDVDSFVEQNLMFFKANNQFDADYMRRLELRTWIRFVAGPLKGIDKDAKRIILSNGTSLHYERLFLMCSSRCSAPKPFHTVPVNYLEANSRLDKIIFYYKIRTLVEKILEHPLPILVYGRVIMAHSCVNTLIELGISATRICLVIPQKTDEMDFPEALHDDHVMALVYSMETEMGIQMYKDYQIVDWYLHPQENAIEGVIFESKFERVEVKCLAFIGFHEDVLSHQIRETLRAQNIELVNNRVLIDQHLRTNIPHVYSCGAITQYQETLFAKQDEQRFFNQMEIGEKLGKNFIEERLSGRAEVILETNFTKPIFRQTELIGGLVYAGLRKPGRSIPREISKNFSSYGHDLVTTDGQGEYCRVGLDKNGFVNEITCLTRKYSNLEILYRIYNIHESMLNNMKRRCALGEIKNLLDFFHESSFSMIIHDKFKLLRNRIHVRNLECVKDFINDKKKINRSEIQQYLIDRGMQENMHKDVFAFIKKHFQSLHTKYALPEDFTD